MPEKSSKSIGVYFSANDVVYDWAIAFLNSFRQFNPDLPLFLIPFNEATTRLLKLQSTYNFEIFEDVTFPRLEAIGQDFELGHTATGPFWFRRYAAFWGPLDYFMYLDVRQLVLADLKPTISAIITADIDFIHYDCALDQVYEKSAFRTNLLKQNRARGFNSGRWISKKGLFTIGKFEQLSSDALQIRDQLNPRNTDQAFINYCCDKKPVRYVHIAELLGGICQNAWVREAGKIYQTEGKYYRWDFGGLDHRKQLLLLHWAGIPMNYAMPQYFLFLKFYTSSKLQQTLLFLLRLPQILFARTFLFMRSQRIFNQLYHRFFR